ncbi:MAG: nuclear transport factor 2 family protein [Acidimicrobiales bacterium]
MDQLQQLVERQAIADVMHAYCRLIDARDTAAFVELFTEDCVANYTRDDLRGKAEIHAFVDKFIQGLMQATQHQVSNFEIELTGDAEARSVSYVSAWHRFKKDRPDYLVHGQYHDRWRKEAGTWRIAERRIVVLGEVDQPKL